MKEKCLFFFDIDGTIFFNGKISDRNKKALQKLHDSGHEIYIDTGRSRSYVPKEVINSAPWDGMICGCAYIERHGKVILNKVLPDNVIKTALELLKKYKFKTTFEGLEHTFNVFPDGSFENLLDDGFKFHTFENQKITKLTIFGDIMNNADYQKIKEVHYIDMTSYAEAMAKGFDKSTGIEILCQNLNIDRANTVAFGDSMNDFDMLKYAGTSIVISHAPKILDSVADYRSQSEEDGVSEMLKKLKFI